MTRPRFQRSTAQRFSPINNKTNMKYFYSMNRITFSDKGKELWACAGRSGGLMAITLDENGRPQDPRSLQSAITAKDYVGACAIGNSEMPRATVSLSRNGEVDFFIDLIQDKTPLTWHFSHTEGAAYCLAALGGHLFILTSKGLYTCVDIVERFLRGELRVGVEMVTVRHLPLEIIDFSLAYNKWMMVLLHDKVVRIDIKDMLIPSYSAALKQSGEQTKPVESSGAEPIWADITLPSAVEQLAVA